MSNTIKVIIEAGSGQGKSCIAHAIAKMLSASGIECTISGKEDERPGIMERTWPKRLQSVADKGTCVEIETKQALRCEVNELPVVTAFEYPSELQIRSDTRYVRLAESMSLDLDGLVKLIDALRPQNP